MNQLIRLSLLDLELELRFNMKKISYLIFFIIFFSSNVKAEIVYIDINYILISSSVGQSLNLQIDNLSKKDSLIYENIEKDLIKREKTLIAQQNILNEDEFKKKLSNLSREVNKYRADKNASKDKLNKIKIENTKKILQMLNPIITKYVEENSISLVIPKKNIIVGKKNLDITDQILKKLNDMSEKLDLQNE